MLNGLDCTAAQLRTTAKGSQCRLTRLLLAGTRGRPRIVELIGRAETTDAAHRRSALLDREESAIRSAAPAAAIDRAPGVGIIGHGVGLRRR